MPAQIIIKFHQPVKGSTVNLLGVESELNWHPQKEGFLINIPDKIRENSPCNYVWTIKVTELKQL
jgi:hypothetical protein